MKLAKQFIPGLFVLFFFAACSPSNDINWPTEKWKMLTFDGSHYIEVWEQTGSNQFKGSAVVRSNGEQLYEESTRIFQEGETWFYGATAKNQNEGKEVLFKLVDVKENYWRFENPEHDFPQYLEYQIISEDSATVMVSNLEETIQRHLKFARVKD